MRYSEIIGESRKPHTLFHSSPASITSFAPLSHFGSRAAALQRATNAVHQNRPMKLYEVNLNSENPLRIRDLTSKIRSSNHNWSNLADLLHYTVKKITAAERDSIYAAAAPSGTNSEGGTQRLIEVLQSHGWDALVYKNEFEDAGSQSWISLTAAQVQIVKIEDIEASPPS